MATLGMNPRLFYFRRLTERQGRPDLEGSLGVKSALVVRRRVMLLLEQARENKLVFFIITYFYGHSRRSSDNSAIHSKRALTSFCPPKGT